MYLGEMFHNNKFFAIRLKLAKSSDPSWWIDSKEGRQHTIFGLNKIHCDGCILYNLICFRLWIGLIFKKDLV